METLIIILLILVLSALAYGIYVVKSNREQSEPEGGLSELFLQQFNELSRLQNELTRRVDERLHTSSEKMHESLRSQAEGSMRTLREVTEKLVRLDETNKQVVSFADQLQNLQDILKNPKQRGILGEYYLETTLKNVLPPNSYQMQYRFNDGEIVDAAVFVRDRVIPIDSKFSLENYNRLVGARDPSERERLEKLFKADLKKRIEETAKYIRPVENTMEFAFMFIPHEAIYYDLLVNEIGSVKVNTKDLIEYAFSKGVVIVSPTSFHAFLQTVLQGLKALQIEESAKEIQIQVEKLGKHLKAYESYHEKLGTSLKTVVNHYNHSSKEFRKIDKDVARVTGGSAEFELNLLERPGDTE